MLPSDTRVFAHRPFAVFWLSRVVGNLAFQMQVVAVGWQVYSLTGDPLDLGLVGLIQFLPSLFLLLVVGQVADRYDRLKVVLLSRLALAAALGVLAVVAAVGAASREAIFLVVLAIGAAHAFQQPTSQAVVPQLVPTALLPKAIAWSSIGFQGSSIVGPAVGGFLYLAGPAAVYGVSFLLYLASALLVLAVRPVQKAPAREPVTRDSLLAGFAFIRANPVILGAISLDMFMVLLGGATALMPVFAQEILLVGPWSLGLMRAAPGVGALLMAAAFAIRPLQRRVGRAMFVAAAGFGVSIIVFGLSRNLWLSLAALAALGAFDMINIVVRQSIVQLDTPDAMRGRVAAVNGVFIGASNQLGEFESGLTASWWGVVPATVVGGIGTLVVAGLWIKLFPALWARDRMHRDDGDG